MNEQASPQSRIVERFPEPEFSALRNAAFADFGECSALLSEVLAEEADRRLNRPEERVPQELRIGAFIEDRLVAWSYSKVEGSQLHMVNSGVLPDLRRKGIYSRLVEATITYAGRSGFAKIFSRHVPSDNAVIIPKLRLGFMASNILRFMARSSTSPILPAINGANYTACVPCQSFRRCLER